MRAVCRISPNPFAVAAYQWRAERLSPGLGLSYDAL